MTDLVVLLVVLALWFILNLWILPRLGMQTCLSGLCELNPQPCLQPVKSETTDGREPQAVSRHPEQGE
ncbi:hypothetical protein [Gimesia sp.]|uniref:hypothetical protein n=1 Tax=Gimesia sp. TaxID=2024833 RepID=UPI0032EC1643